MHSWWLIFSWRSSISIRLVLVWHCLHFGAGGGVICFWVCSVRCGLMCLFMYCLVVLESIVISKL